MWLLLIFLLSADQDGCVDLLAYELGGCGSFVMHLSDCEQVAETVCGVIFGASAALEDGCSQ